MNEKKTYSYSYSAAENAEIKKIRDKYAKPDERETKLEQLRRLDASVNKTSVGISLTIGIIGALILGFGMSCVMVWTEKMFVPGIVIGIVGLAITVLAYPAYQMTLKKMRNEVGPTIIRLTDELIK